MLACLPDKGRASCYLLLRLSNRPSQALYPSIVVACNRFTPCDESRQLEGLPVQSQHCKVLRTSRWRCTLEVAKGTPLAPVLEAGVVARVRLLEVLPLRRLALPGSLMTLLMTGQETLLVATEHTSGMNYRTIEHVVPLAAHQQMGNLQMAYMNLV